MNLKSKPDETLKGHKLLLLSPWKPSAEWLDRIRDEYPGLEVSYHTIEFGAKTVAVPDEEWSRVTILLTGSYLPKKNQVPRLQYVQLISAGANQILKNPLFLETDVTFCTANGVHGPQISEWVICTFLAAQHAIPGYLDQQREGKWKRGASMLVDDAVGQRVGILGYGSIGRQVARVAKALGMDVFAYTLHPRDTPESRRDNGFSPPGLGDPEGVFPSRWFSGTTTEELHEFLGSGIDLLVVATPLTDKTHHLLSAPEFEVLAKKKAYISNIGRGPIIHTDHLIDALDRELVRGAALDVTDPEPLPDGHPLWRAKNIIITPHVSGGSTKYSDRVLTILEGNLERLRDGRELANRVSRREGY